MPPRPAGKSAKTKNARKRKERQESPVLPEPMGGSSRIDGQRGPKRRKAEPKPPQHESSNTAHPGPREAPHYTSTSVTVGAGHFSGSHHFHVENQTINTHIEQSKELFDYLGPHVAHGAAHDAKDRRDAPACHEETRVAIREDVFGWFKHDEGKGEPRKVMWISGPAGAGKSAIAGSVAETCKTEGILAATFFFSSFSSSMDRRWSRGLIATLVHHMSQHQALDQFSVHLLSALKRRPDIFHKTLKEQAEHLILGPFRRIDRKERARWPKAVIVDGVDEVFAPDDPTSTAQQPQRKSEDDQVEVLEVLLKLCQSPDFPFRILIVSRPERRITDFFDNVRAFTIPLFLDGKYEPDADIERYLWSKFSQIRRRFGLSNVSWPGQSAVDRIIDMSSGQFIVPATVIRWIESGVPQRQLDEILNLEHGSVTSRNPFEALDALYRHILVRAENTEDPRLVIKWVQGTDNGVLNGNLTATFWRWFFQDYEGEFDYRMGRISSLISIPPLDDTESRITFYHKSLQDYLLTETRCKDLYVTREEVDAFVSRRILVVLRNKGPSVPLSDPKRLDDFIETFVDLSLMHPSASSGCRVTDIDVRFLKSLEYNDMQLLASCDARWWTRRTLAVSNDTRGGFGRLIRGMYVGVHRALQCSSRPGQQSRSIRQIDQQEQGPQCHPACINWRTGIITEAKELGRCTHTVECLPRPGDMWGCPQWVPDDAGEDLLEYFASRLFEPLPSWWCAICRPGRSEWG